MTMDCRFTRTPASVLRTAVGVLPMLVGFLTVAPSLAGEPPPSETAEIVATIGGSPVHRQELLDAAAADLDKLDEERLQLEVRYATTRHRLLAQALTRLTQQRLLQAEAAQRHLSIQQLLAQELNGKVQEVTQEQLDSFYQLNRATFDKPEAQVAGELRAKLASDNLDEARMRYVDQLRRKFGVDNRLGPLRLPVAATGPVRGNETAPVTLVEFADFECPYCTTLAPLLRKAVETWPNEIRVVFRQLPLEETHAHAWPAAEAALCAGEQHRFWEMHDALYAAKGRLDQEQLTAVARALGLDLGSFAQCLSSHRSAAQINHDLHAANALGLQGTPSLFINGRRVGIFNSLTEIRSAIDEELGSGKSVVARAVPHETQISTAKGVAQYCCQSEPEL